MEMLTQFYILLCNINIAIKDYLLSITCSVRYILVH